MDCDTIQSIDMDRVDDEDSTFRISTHTPGRDLKRSIQTVGLLHLPVVWAKHGRLVVVSGFARITACRALKWTRMAARCLPPETPFAHCALTAVADNAGQRDLNSVELARALELLDRAARDHAEVPGLAQSIGLAVSPQWIEKLKPVPQMNDRLQEALCNGAIPLPIALRLHHLPDPDAAEHLRELFQCLGWGLNRQREFLDWVEAIAHRDEVTLSAILGEKGLLEALGDANPDKGLKAQRVRAYIKRRRYPLICAFEARYAQTLKQLKTAPGVHLSPPVHFEGTTYSLRLDFENQADLHRLSNEVRRLADAAALGHLMDLYQTTADDR